MGKLKVVWNEEDEHILKSTYAKGMPMLYWLRCVICQTTNRIQLHHTDYENDIVIPLCSKHHFHLHIRGRFKKYHPKITRRKWMELNPDYTPEKGMVTGRSLSSRAIIRRMKRHLLSDKVIRIVR